MHGISFTQKFGKRYHIEFRLGIFFGDENFNIVACADWHCGFCCDDGVSGQVFRQFRCRGMDIFHVCFFGDRVGRRAHGDNDKFGIADAVFH